MARLAGRNIEVRKALQVTALGTSSADATAAAGAAPTKAEFDVVVTLVNELKGDHNTLVNDLKA